MFNQQALVPEGTYGWQIAFWACLLGADTSSGEVLSNPDSIASRNVSPSEANLTSLAIDLLFICMSC